MTKDLITLKYHFLPLKIVLCFSDRAYNKVCEYLKQPKDQYLTKDGVTRIIYNGDDDPIIMLCFEREKFKKMDLSAVAGIVCHEIIHAITFATEAIGQGNRADSEFEAYLAQYIMIEALENIYGGQNGPKTAEP